MILTSIGVGLAAGALYFFFLWLAATLEPEIIVGFAIVVLVAGVTYNLIEQGNLEPGTVTKVTISGDDTVRYDR